MKSKLLFINIAALALLFASGMASATDPYYGAGSYNASYRSLGFYGPNLNNQFYRGQSGANRGWYSGGTQGYYFTGAGGGPAYPGPQTCYIWQCGNSPLPAQCNGHPICTGAVPQPKAFWWHYYDWDGAHDPNPYG